jgi:GAF domain-containing protein
MPNSTFSRFRKEQILRRAGVDVPPYPTGSGVVSAEADAQLLAAGTEWERQIDRLYVQFLTDKAVEPPISDPTDYARLCESLGVTAALLELNRRVPHRYTAAYRLEGQRLRNVELIDKAREDRPEFLAEVPLEASFCQFVLRQGKFLTSDSGEDSRLDGHPYKGVMVAYHGVPIVDDAGALLGTLCHFDIARQPFTEGEFEHLQSVGRIIHRFLPR